MGTQSPPDDGPEQVPPTDTPGPDRDTLVFVGVRTLVLVAVVAVGYLTRPIWHGLVYSAIYSPTGLLVVGGGSLAAVALLYLPPDRLRSGGPGSGGSGGLGVTSDGPDPIGELTQASDGTAAAKVRLLAVVVGLLIAVSFLIGGISGTLEQRTLAQETMADATEVEEFPEANPENPRVVPRRVSEVTTRGEVSYRQHRLGASDIARREDGSLAWSYPIEPDGFRNTLLENQRGVLLSDMTRIDDRRTETYDDTDFTHGEGMFLHRSADWQLKKTDYLARYNDDAVEFTHDGTPYMYYPKTGHEWRLAPFPHTVPVWDGGALVTPDGEIRHLTPEEAQANDILDGQRLYPVSLTRVEMGSLGYRNGIVNQLPVVGAHRGEVELATLPDGADNRQPFIIDLAGERLSYVTAMEPYGIDSRGLDEVWFADAETGEYTFFGTDRETLTGPERAMGIARSEDSQTNWGRNFVVTEPVPTIVDENLWWHIKVSPVDFTDVTRNVFVNADSGSAVAVQTDDETRAFIRGDINESKTGGGQADENASDDRTDSDVIYSIVITNESGDVVERIPVRSGQDTSIVPPDDDRVTVVNGTANATAANETTATA
ncbi:hypothetical protein GCM10008995_19700 [Halobellus salinus]|uniref:Uncharacterized protein n=1 Tax=Halobellus salinus TaxID=931585 RepID=A0A830EC23_9EURY|nr:hypothetical protein [Halobellus salinus]GGJ09862.1 hypothetical protein GCM10008995_19700 [Halobellus salinus]SMP24857.1 hypothetical protein SAMN06265347_11069 [Halobellus salinus]